MYHGARSADGRDITPDRVRRIEEQELARIRDAIGPDAYARGKYDEAGALFETVALGESLVEFLTIPAYDRID